ncbi:MAG: DUF4367 domain-containing protein [Peptococcaceae bacterium]|nr:DUF4367 domain-containing protein [Peptococcaceae bacterium]
MATRKELLEQYEDAQFALLIDEIMEQQGAELNEMKQQLKHDPAAAVPHEVRERSMETIRKAYEERDKKQKARRIRTTVRTLLVAAVVAALLLTTVSADFRLAAKNFVYELTELAAELMFDFGDDNARYEPAGEVIMGYFIPALPDDFELVDATETAHSVRRQYNSEKGFVMIRVVEDDGNGLTYSTDAENLNTSKDRINEFDILIIESSNRIQFVLSDTERQMHIEITSNILSYKEIKYFVSRIKNN